VPWADCFGQSSRDGYQGWSTKVVDGRICGGLIF
jgi:hypothetical protein